MTVAVATFAASSARTNFARHTALLAGVSAAAMFMASPEAYARPLGSWTPAPSAAAIAAAQSGSAEAARAARQAANSLKRATLAIQSMQATQAAARDAAKAALNAMPNIVPNGLRPGGLQIGTGVVGADGSVNQNLWQGANLPTQFTDGDRTKVDIKQTQQKAILTWDTFNVGGKTDLTFDQQGNRSWVALNRVLGNDGKPSQILGNMKADGSVYVVNQNGIIFGGASQVNVGALIASTAKISNEQFLSGIYSTQTGSTWNPSFTDAAALLGNGTGGGVVKVVAGAQIETHAPASVTAGGGFVLLLGGQVDNAGAITTPKGQALLAAGDDFVLRRGYGTDANISSTTRGNEIATLFDAGSLAGLVRNSGIIFSPQGDITLAGRTIEQNGILVASTSVNTRGTIHLLNSAIDTLGSVTLGADSVTMIIPELESSETALNSQRDALIKASDPANAARSQSATGAFDNLSLLADRLDQSRIEIVTGGNVVFKGGAADAGSLTIAQGGQVAVSAGGRIFTESGAAIDVSGVRDVVLAMSANNIMINIQGNELRDSPGNRDNNYLKNANVWVDIRDLIFVPSGTGGYQGDRYYTPGGLLEVGGYLANTAHTIGEWSAVGGTITLSAPEVIAQQGSIFDISGGSVRYESGNIRTTNFLGKDGRLYNINYARGDMTFYGLGRGFIRESKRWGVTQVWTGPFGRGRESVRWEEGYTVGRDAGKLVLSTPTAIFEGKILADVVQGDRQINARPVGVTDGYKLGQNNVALGGTLAVGQYTALGRTNVYDTDVRITDIESITSGLDATGALAVGRTGTLWLDAGHLNEQHLGGLDIATRGSISIDSDLVLADGGSVSLIAPVTDIKANITARSGSVTVVNFINGVGPGNPLPQALTHASGTGITLHAGATIDTGGLWVNALKDPNDYDRLAYVDGGDVRLESTHDVNLADGSLIDVSSGGGLLHDGKSAGGKGGSVTLAADFAGTATNGGGRLKLDGALKGYGVAGGGALSITTGGRVVIGGAPVADVLNLSADRFHSGFASYDINGHAGVAVAPGTSIKVVMPVYRASAQSFDIPASADPSQDLARGLELWEPPLFLENPLRAELRQRAGASLTLRSERMNQGGSVEIGTGAGVSVDPGQKITLRGGGQITVEGRLEAPGGAIAIEDIRSALMTYQGSAHNRSIWIGENAVLDVAGRALTAIDARGRRYGAVQSGGNIEIGGSLNWEGDTIVDVGQPDLHLIIRPGALLDASGASATLDIPVAGRDQYAAATVAGDGGTIVLTSANSMHLDGTMRAAAGGSNAAGGTLAIALGGAYYQKSATADVLAPRVLTLSQVQGESLLGDNLAAGEADPALTYGRARLGVDRIKAGGFGNLSIFSEIATEGNLVLDMAQSLRLWRGIAVAADAPAGSRVALSASQIFLGATEYSNRDQTGDWYSFPTRSPRVDERHDTLTAIADLIDIRNSVELVGFSDVSLTSRGDLRLLDAIDSNTIRRTGTEIIAPGLLRLTAAQIYPATGVNAFVGVGNLASGGFSQNPAGKLVIASHGGAVPAVPYSIFGSLTLDAVEIEQGGVVRAPLGSITVGSGYGDYPQVRFLPGSLTSVSGAGLVMPYSGTADGIKYSYDGQEIEISPVGGGADNLGRTRKIAINAKSVIVEEGAILDMSGGGDIRGAGFVSGRGGSVDVLRYALADANPAYGFSVSGSEVYAIVPGYAGAYAPETSDIRTPGIGRQITIGNGVAGLPAGTYTLMPASYALLPGAFRIEIGKGGAAMTGGAVQTGSGSFIASGTLGTANTGIRNGLESKLIVTPADVVRKHSGYNELSYNDFLLADAARRGFARPMLTVDARALELSFAAGAGLGGSPALTFKGTALFAPAENSVGFGGQLSVNAGSLTGGIEILGAGVAPISDSNGVALYADQLNAFNPNRMIIGGSLTAGYGRSGLSVGSGAEWVIVRGGAVLSAPEVILAANSGGRGIVVEQGAVITTIGKGLPAYDSSDGYYYEPNGAALVVSNGWVNLLAPSFTEGGTVTIDLGGCVSLCSGETRIVSEGTIGASTYGAFTLRDTVSYGTKNLVLGVSAVNLGAAGALADAAAAGELPPGMTLNQDVLARLLRAIQAIGAPGLETLVLNAKESINIYGSVELDTLDPSGKSAVERLVFGAPAIYGYGAAGDAVTIRTGEFVWAGSTAVNSVLPGDTAAQLPGAPVLGRLGDGTLNVIADTIRFDYAPNTRPVTLVSADRLALGFTDVNLTANNSIVAGGKGSLSVHHTQNGYVAGEGWRHSGGNLTIRTPLMTGDAGSRLKVKAGGAIDIAGSGAVAASSNELGAELSFAAQSIRLDTSVTLPSGRLMLEATGDIVLGDAARIDLAGREIVMFDVKKYSWGGDLVLSSRDGNIRAAAGSLIDLSAQYNRGGSLEVTALGAAAGNIALLGAIRGKASGLYDAGGTYVPYDGAQLTLRAQTLDDFAALNERLNTGEVFGVRRFQIKRGDLVVGDGVKARDVEIVLDGGDLTVNGRIDASGHQVGSIRLAAKGNLTVNGTLDAHGTGLRRDSYGKIIESPNRAMVTLASSDGMLTLGTQAVVDLRAGTESAFADGKARGTLDLVARRIGTDDVAVDVQGAIDVKGAKTVAVYGLRTYDDAPLADTPDVSGERPQLITQKWFNEVIDPDNTAFMNAALGNSALSGRLAGLGAYRLRPGVEIVSNALTNPAGNLTVAGDLDLSNYRYGPDANRLDPARRGFGEPGMLVLRAAGNLNIHGSINDGFAPPAATPDDKGWYLNEARPAAGTGMTPFGGDIVVPIDGVKLESGTIFPAGSTLNYDIPVRTTTLPAGTTLPADVILTAALSLPAGSVLGADVMASDGNVYRAGTVLQLGLELQAGSKLGAGFQLRSDASVAGFVWPKGEKLPVDLKLSGRITLARGSLIPSMTNVELKDDQPVNLRPVSPDGTQGRNWALAPMLREGSTSWDLTAVAGADLGSADMRARNAAGKGDIVLADTHYAALGKVTTRYEGGGGGGPLMLTEEGALNIIGDPAVKGMTQEEVDAWMQANWGMTWKDMYGEQTLADACGLGAGYCVNKPGEVILTPDGALNIIGDVAVAGMTQAEVSAWMKVNWGSTWEEIFAGTTLADTCAAYGAGYCVNKGAEPPREIKEYTFGEGGANFSVVRTGTGDLDLLAGRDVRMMSMYGVYTAGVQTSLPGVDNTQFNLPRGHLGQYLLGDIQGSGKYDAALADWQAWYPDFGGNLTVSAGRDVIGDSWGETAMNGAPYPDGLMARVSSAGVGNWLWRQGTGTTTGVDPISTSWWINFGAYTLNNVTSQHSTPIAGFTGFGALGGGNVDITAGRHAGLVDPRGAALPKGAREGARSQGLVAVVGSSGRVIGNDIFLTGGGDLSVKTGGALNPNARASQYEQRSQATSDNLDLNGVLVNLRGMLSLSSSSIGAIAPLYTGDGGGLRPDNPFAAGNAHTMGGPVLMLGDAAAFIDTRGDLVLGGAGDPGRVFQLNNSPYATGTPVTGGGNSWFSLWTANTAINLMSAGGDVTPMALGGATSMGTNLFAEGGSNYYVYPSILRAVAANGDIRLGQSLAGQVLLLAPSPTGQLELLAGGSIRGGEGKHRISQSGTATPLPTPFNPAFAVWENGLLLLGNVSSEGIQASPGNYTLFAFGPNSAAGSVLQAGHSNPARFYAVDGDIVGLSFGGITNVSQWPSYFKPRVITTWYEAATPVHMRAGMDILGVKVLALNNETSDVSVVEAGRDIVHANLTVAGPGQLDVHAGRHIRQDDAAGVLSLGSLIAGGTRPGASISLMAGATGVNWDGVRDRYLDPANLADPASPLSGQPGKAVKTYEKELAEWLKARYGREGSVEENLSYFDALAPEQQHIFLRQIYFAELRAGGREYNDPQSSRFGSYLRGREMIATLFPDKDALGHAIKRPGDIVMFGGSGAKTEFGGDIEMMASSGQIVIGVEGQVPPSTAGVVTQGQGNIGLFSKGSILLGLSRIMTTFGGDILAWSAEGDINAGRGAKTTIVYAPPRRVYDSYGNVTLSPGVPSSGAGVSSESSVPGVPGGDIDLIAPLGTIDAGEAGIRSGANVNIAALHIVNAANISAQGTTTGVPQIQAPNIGGLTEASNVAGGAAQQAAVPQQDSGSAQPSIIIVEVLGFGGGSGEDQPDDEKRRGRGRQSNNSNYDSNNVIRLLGNGTFTTEDTKQLTAVERDTLTSQVVTPNSP